LTSSHSWYGSPDAIRRRTMAMNSASILSLAAGCGASLPALY
jgi:hypothetical protein